MRLRGVSNENRPWVRVASSALLARGLLKGNKLLAESALEAARTQGFPQESAMLSNTDYRQIIRRSLGAAALLAALICIGVAIHAVSAGRAASGFELANDFPRGAVVYAQFKDLPAAIKQWDESALKDRFLKSVNYQKLWSRHLANKLFSRWEEFNAAAGFSLGASAFGAIADNRAAIAVYDIGRLDLVVIAPLSDAKFAATQFFQSKD